MKRLTKGVLLIGGLAVVTAAGLAAALASLRDPGHYCDTGFSRLVNCNAGMSSHTTGQSTPIFATSASAPDTGTSDTRPAFRTISVDVTPFAVAHCPHNSVARRLLCATPSVASAVERPNDDLAAGLPLPNPWVVRTAKNSPSIEAVHVETPLDLAVVLGLYRAELSKRGWTPLTAGVPISLQRFGTNSLLRPSRRPRTAARTSDRTGP